MNSLGHLKLTKLLHFWTLGPFSGKKKVFSLAETLHMPHVVFKIRNKQAETFPICFCFQGWFPHTIVWVCTAGSVVVYKVLSMQMSVPVPSLRAMFTQAKTSNAEVDAVHFNVYVPPTLIPSWNCRFGFRVLLHYTNCSQLSYLLRTMRS